MNTDNLMTVLTTPTPAAIWQLRGDLLESGWSHDSVLFEIIGRYYTFLDGITATLTAVQYNEWAHWLSIGSGFATLAESYMQVGTSDLMSVLFPSGISEALEVFSSHQYVKSAEAQLHTHINQAAYHLYNTFWIISSTAQPHLSNSDRRHHLEHLFNIIHTTENEMVKGVLIGRLFQYLLLTQLTAHAV